MAITRVGLVADTHTNIRPLPDAARDALAGVDLILHCGDWGGIDLLDDLGAIAPVRATRSTVDPAGDPPRINDGPTVVTVGGVDLGLVHQLGNPEEAGDDGIAPLPFPRRSLASVMDEMFGGAVAVVVYGGTHQARVLVHDGVLLVNPGSPTLAEVPTVARLTIEDGVVEVEIVRLPTEEPT